MLRSDGYVSVWAKGHPAANAGGKALEHRLVWWDAHGPIPDGFQVHHKNSVRHDNRLENLELLPAGDHTLHHATTRGIDNQFGTEYPATINRDRTCSAAPCEKPARKRGLCYGHYDRTYRPGRPWSTERVSC